MIRQLVAGPQAEFIAGSQLARDIKEDIEIDIRENTFAYDYENHCIERPGIYIKFSGKGEKGWISQRYRIIEETYNETWSSWKDKKGDEWAVTRDVSMEVRSKDGERIKVELKGLMSVWEYNEKRQE